MIQKYIQNHPGTVQLEYRTNLLNHAIDTLSTITTLGIVYALWCKPNRRCYIGITRICCVPREHETGKRIERFRTHIRQLKRDIHPAKKLQVDWNEYGEGQFVFDVLDVMPVHTTGSAKLVWGSNAALRQREAFWHSEFSDLYSHANYDPLATCAEFGREYLKLIEEQHCKEGT